MKRKVLALAGVITAGAIAISPLAIYAAGSNVGTISVMNEGVETIHIVASDFDNIDSWKTDMDAHEDVIDAKMEEIRANAQILESVTP